MSIKKSDDHKKSYKDKIELILLKTTNDSHELSLIRNLLDQNNIPYILKDRGSGGYMRIMSGFSIYGTDILVEKSTFKKAKSIIDELPWDK
ncbi:DUF2007 domain-containing protein [Schnuerera sp. xch1]|uniref:putative signal transducing protein n=1 Tax=Schnuerera sp. xch1 TaxID=2874283 RepID=UPI001CC08861|nr:DUF2007 domain-containing protein [Schnuerera sp. xch1]MBZ2174471.1 DUF2007 domain-containing protein [Schnuerera sp. xch1]